MTHLPEANGKKPSKAPGDELVQPPPPDGGWGWVVVFASFMIHVITDGVTYSYGLFHEEFLVHFDTTNEAAAWITSLLVGVTYCSGPFSSFLVNKFGCRLVTIAGTLLTSACLLASVYAKNVTTLYFTAGIGTGLGFGLIYLPAIVSVTVYFEKYRSLATGIAVCGSGLGTVVFSQFIKYLITFYGGYKFSMMILSAIVLNCIIFGIMFRPLKPVKSSECVPLKDITRNGISNDEKKVGMERRLSISQLSPKKYPSNKSVDNTSNNIRLALSQPILVSKDGSQPSNEPFNRATGGSGIMNRSDVFLRSSIHSIRKRSESLNDSEENMRFRLSLRSLPNGAGHRSSEVAQGQDDNDNSNIIKRMLQFSLLKDPLFIIFTVSNFCTSIGFNVPYVYLGLQAQQQGLDSADATKLLSAIGIANAVGRIILGYVSDKPWVNRLLVYNLCLTFCGLATAFSVYCSSYLTFAVYACVYGFTAGAYVGLTSVCLVDLVGLDRLTNAFGLVLLSQGIASFLGLPLAGMICDAYKSYNAGFIVAGSMITISGVMLFFIPPIQRCMLKKEERMQRINTVA